MIIVIDGKAIYDVLDYSRKRASETRKGDGGESWKGKDDDDPNAVNVSGCTLALPSTRMPLPFGSIDGRFISFGERYAALVELNPPEFGDLYPNSIKPPANFLGRILERHRIKKNMYKLEECHRRIPGMIERGFNGRYVRLGVAVDGYILDARGQNRMAIRRDQKAEILSFRMGGSGLKPMGLEGEASFCADMDMFGEDITKIVNYTLDEAVKIGLAERNPDMTLRVGPHA